MPRLARCFTVGSIAIMVLVGGANGVLAVPPPPPNPSDAEIQAGQSAATAKAGEVGVLANRLATAETQLQQLADQVELAMEDANKARVDLQTAQSVAAGARADADAAKADADSAAKSVADARTRLDDFAAGSLQQGSTVGSMTAFFGARNPQDMLDRAQLLDAISRDQLNSLDTLERAQADQANKDSTARLALQVATAKRAAADAAAVTADSARDHAVQARQNEASQAKQLHDSKDSVEQQLYAAQSSVSGLQNQRQRYEDWVAQKQREEAEAARQAAEAAAAAAEAAAHQPPALVHRPGHGGGHGAGEAPSSGSVQAVLNRALSVIGVTYAWGGGDADGPTRGIRDGGVADSYGDYQKVGFDCSGLMIYAFAAAGVSLPHYSGYQYTSGRHVPLSQIEPGDMLFWGNYGDIHHVALYLGGGRMIEAPFSGASVRVVPVRYSDEILPYATRML